MENYHKTLNQSPQVLRILLIMKVEHRKKSRKGTQVAQDKIKSSTIELFPGNYEQFITGSELHHRYIDRTQTLLSLILMREYIT